MQPHFTTPNSRFSSYGFTLVELAIALMVIGLLIGGVLKGQELIDNARVTSVMRQVKAYDAAVMIFRNTYGALPGDIRRPNRVPNCTEDLCLRPGNGNGKIAWGDTSSPSGAEMYNFFPHLTKAGMIQGPEGGTIAQMSGTDNNDLFLPSTALDLYMDVNASEPFRQGDYHSDDGARYPNAYNLPSMHSSITPAPIIPVRFMSQIDGKMDDGKPHSGDIQILSYGDCPSSSYMDGGDNEYESDDTNNRGGCPLAFVAGF